MEMLIKNEQELVRMYHVLQQHGKWTQPRGEKTLEIENFSYTVNPFVRFNSFKGRNFNLKYLKREMAWYIKADPMDLSITEHAAQWGKIVANGKLNSNYGSYWFGRFGVKHIVRLLQQDSMSRRAVIPMYGGQTQTTWIWRQKMFRALWLLSLGFVMGALTCELLCGAKTSYGVWGMTFQRSHSCKKLWLHYSMLE